MMIASLLCGLSWVVSTTASPAYIDCNLQLTQSNTSANITTTTVSSMGERLVQSQTAVSSRHKALLLSLPRAQVSTDIPNLYRRNSRHQKSIVGTFPTQLVRLAADHLWVAVGFTLDSITAQKGAVHATAGSVSGGGYSSKTGCTGTQNMVGDCNSRLFVVGCGVETCALSGGR